MFQTAAFPAAVIPSESTPSLTDKKILLISEQIQIVRMSLWLIVLSNVFTPTRKTLDF